MLNIPEAIKTLYQMDSIRKNFRVVFPNGELPDITNANVVTESVTFTESLCSQEVLKFGLTEAPTIEFETVGVDNMYGMTIKCFNEIDTSSLSAEDIAAIQAMTDLDGELVLEADSDIGYGFYRLPLGVFRVDSCPRSHGKMSHRRVVAYGFERNIQETFAQMFDGYRAYKDLKIDLNGLVGMAAENTLTKMDKELSESSSYTVSCCLFDGTGKAYLLQIGAAMTSCNFHYGSETNDLGADFGKVYFKYDEESYNATGRAIADALDNAGFDFTYNAYKKKLWDSNEEALREIATYLFAPSLLCSMDYVVWCERITSGELHPLVCSDDNSRGSQHSFPRDYEKGSDRAFYAKGTSTHPQITQRFMSFSPHDAGTFSVVVRPLTGETQPTTLSNIPYPTGIELGSAYRYLIPAPTTYKLSLKSETTTKKRMLKNAQTIKSSVTGYLFPDQREQGETAVISALELCGLFSGRGRSGNSSSTTLDRQSPVSIGTNLYSELWWDEYDVSPIGGIQYQVGGDGNEDGNLVYQFGDGQSIYDMTDNYVLQNMDGANEETINALLNTHFIPNIQDVYFTPTDCNMKGLPYLEAGDFLEIDSGDVDENDQPINAETFIMRRTMSGIQSLRDTIESSGGEIISGGYYVTEVEDEQST